MIKVLATDLDGTLLKPIDKHNLIAKENIKYLESFYGDIVIVSGRGPKFCAKVCNKLKIEHHFVAHNGAVIVKNGNVIYRQSMKKTILNNLKDFLVENFSNYQLVLFDKYDKIICFSPIPKHKLKAFQFKRHLKVGKLFQKTIISNKKALKILNDQTDIHKVVIYAKEDTIGMGNLLKEKFNEHFEFFISNKSVEITPKGVNKGAGLKYLIDTANIKEDEVIVVGDSANDIPMFDLFPNSFAVDSNDASVQTRVKYNIEKFTDLDKYTRLNKNFH